MNVVRTLFPRLTGFLVAGCLAAGIVKGSLQEALVNRTLNEVFIHENADPDGEFRQAKAGEDQISGEQVLRTGLRSRAELIFGDESIARIGSNAVFTFVPEQREMFLGRGLMLYQAPKNSGPTRISTATATASITGTTLLVEVGENVTKIILLEGAMSVSIPGRLGEYVTLKPGQMLIFPNDATRLPNPVDVDISLLVQSSGITGAFDEMGENGEVTGQGEDKLSLILIDRESEIQQTRIQEGELDLTDLAIFGKGSRLHFLIDPERRWLLERVESQDSVQDRSEQVAVNRDTRSEEEEEQPQPPVPAPLPPTPPTPNPIPDPIVFHRPPLIENPNPFILGEDAAIHTNPSIVVGENAFAGAKYLPEAGTMSQFLFGETTAQDIRFGVDSWASQGASSWFRFASLELTGDPEAINVLSGIERIGLVSEGALSVLGGNYIFAPLQGLTLTANQGIDIDGGVYWENRDLDLRLYNRSETEQLMVRSGSYLELGSLELYSVADIAIEGNTELLVTDDLRIRAEGEVVIGDPESYQYPVVLEAENLHVEAGTLVVGQGVYLSSGGGFSGQGQGEMPISSARMSIKTSGDMYVAGTTYWQLDFGHSILDIGGTLYAEETSLYNLTELQVGGDAWLNSLDSSSAIIGGVLWVSSLSSDSVAVGGDLWLGYSLNSNQLSVGGDLATEGGLMVNHADISGTLTASWLELGQSLRVGEDLVLGNLYAMQTSDYFPEGQGSGGGGDLYETVHAEIHVDGTVHIQSFEQGMGLYWKKNGSLTLNTPVAAFGAGSQAQQGGGGGGQSEPAIYGAYVGQENGDGGLFTVNATQAIIVQNSEIQVIGEGENLGGTLNLNSDGYVHIGEGAVIEASASSNFGGEIAIRANANNPISGYAIEVSSSAEILALAQNSKIMLEAIQGNIAVAGRLEAELVEIVARDAGARVELVHTANIIADTLKAGALGANGELLIGTPQQNMVLSGSELIRLYANLDSGTVRFVGNTSLQSGDVQIAGNKVIVDNGVFVDIASDQAARVYAEQHKYGISGYGAFTGAGATAHPVSEAPAF